MTTLGTPDRALRVAIIGTGPSGFYAAESLVKSGIEVRVDFFEALPCPYGLVRYGVAPDHQKIKTVTKVFERIASRPNVNFYGNVAFGEDIKLDELRRFYDAVILAHGAQSDRRLNIPGEDLPGSHTATEFVAWYNGHPDYVDRTFDLSCETAVVIGQGNVAVDVCRILAKTVDELSKTDIARHALDALAESRIRRIYMIGRRGPVQAKFTQVEIKELGALEACTTLIDPAEMDLGPDSLADLNHPENVHGQRIYPILQEFAKNVESSVERNLYITFRRSPKEIRGNRRVESIVLERNRLEGAPGHVRPVATGELDELPAGLVFRSVGYQGVPLPDVPFDDSTGTVPHEAGRVCDSSGRVAGLYVVGWSKRGPTGVIGTNKPDAHETAESLIADIDVLGPCANPDTEAVLHLLNTRGVQVVTFADWQRIDELEQERGRSSGRPREKIVTREELLSVASEASATN
jgi:ferredoxin--NADP+ reductase